MNVVKRGSKGDDVKLLQQRLNVNGFGPVAEDGDFGAGTETRVKQFQNAQGLEADGVVGNATWHMLLALGPAPDPAATKAADTAGSAGLASLVALLPDDGRRAVLACAAKYVGAKEEPDGSNNGPIVGKFTENYFDKATEARMGRPAWCALFTSHCMKEGLGKADWKEIPYGSRLGGVKQVDAWADKTGRVIKMPEPGCLFLLLTHGGEGVDADHDHVGFVVAVDGDRVSTIEGNTSNAVKNGSRRISSISEFVRWW